MTRTMAAALILGLVAGCTAPRPSTASACPETTNEAVLRTSPGVGVSLFVPERWQTVTTMASAVAFLDGAGTISIGIVRYEDLHPDMPKSVIEIAGTAIGTTEIKLGDGVAREARVVDAVGGGPMRRVIEVLLPEANGVTRVVTASTPVGLAEACRPELDSILATINFD